MKIAILAGSNRKQSTSTMLARYLQSYIERKGHLVQFIDLHQTQLPHYSPDEDASQYEAVLHMQSEIRSADAAILCSPDYHGSVSGVLKNALDYLDAEHFDGKAVLSVTSSGGAVGVSPLQQLQTIVRNVHGINCPEWLSIGGEQRRFDENGAPQDARVLARVERTLNYFLTLAGKLRGI
ncbi:NADPH-dependent oxidoreductase [Paenibacillaceae bacterium]|nr:NADPH-dependent oxidoreductase [Paenibacillaceae bacterium]